MELVEAGKVRHALAARTSAGEQIEQAVELARARRCVKMVSSQPEYLLLQREPEGRHVIPRQRGERHLAGRLPAASRRAGAQRRGTRRARRRAREQARRPARSGWSSLDRRGARRVCSGCPRSRTGSAPDDGAASALAWILREPDVASAIVGASRPDQLRDNAAASGVSLDEADARGRSRSGCPREPQARGLRPAGGARRGARSALRRRRRADRRLRARSFLHRGGPARSSAAREPSPSVGRAGREERVAELRLETVFPAELQDEVLAALRRAHPYEEPAFDIYELVSRKRRGSSLTAAHGQPRPGPRTATPCFAAGGRDGAGRVPGRGDRCRHEQRGEVVAGSSPASEASGGAAARRGRGRPRLRAAREADARRVPRQERGSARALAARRPPARATGREGVRYTAVRREHNELADRLVQRGS